MTRRALGVLGSFVVAATLLVSGGGAAVAQQPPVTPVATMHIIVNGSPSDTSNFDISWVDPRGLYLLADRTNNAVDEFSATRDSFIQFLGKGSFHSLPVPTCLARGASDMFDCGGPNGVVTDDQNRVWVSDGVDATTQSSIKVLPAPPDVGVLANIPIGGKFRSDELAYDPNDEMILLANPDFSDAFLTWLDVSTLHVAGRYNYSPKDKKHWGGLEQPVYDRVAHLFYQAVPGAVDDNGDPVSDGAIDVFSTVPVNGAGNRVKSIPVPQCIGGPTGMTWVSPTSLAGACANGGILVDQTTGKVTTMIPNVGGADQIWYNPGDNHIYFGIIGFPISNLGVATGSGASVQNPLTGGLAHSVAACFCNNQVFVPIAGGGILVFQSTPAS
jgi:hypothetical protein